MNVPDIVLKVHQPESFKKGLYVLMGTVSALIGLALIVTTPYGALKNMIFVKLNLL